MYLLIALFYQEIHSNAKTIACKMKKFTFLLLLYFYYISIAFFKFAKKLPIL